jgi:CRP-like cAMP-binding protein
MSNLLKLAKGDILIREDDASNTLYYLQSGALRVFKKKGKGFIELGVINRGSIVGELSFFDNQRRSASVEAMRECEVVEIPRPNFDEYMNGQPAWVTSLLKTVTAKVRLLTDQLREVESNSVVTKLDDQNKSFREHDFLMAREVMKLISALIVCASTRGTPSADGSVQFPANLFQLLGGNVNSIPLAKIGAFTEILKDLGIIDIAKNEEGVNLRIRDIKVLEHFLFWLSEDGTKTLNMQMSLTKLGISLSEGILASGVLHNCIKLPAAARTLRYSGK